MAITFPATHLISLAMSIWS